MPYNITPYSYRKAKKLGVSIVPSSNKTKKIDVYRDNKKIVEIGASEMNDFPTYIQKRGRKYAETRRRLYKKRHQKYRTRKNTRSYFADQILW